MDLGIHRGRTWCILTFTGDLVSIATEQEDPYRIHMVPRKISNIRGDGLYRGCQSLRDSNETAQKIAWRKRPTGCQQAFPRYQ